MHEKPLSTMPAAGYDITDTEELNDRSECQEVTMGDLWNGMFDFNGDGQTDIGEEYMAYRIFEAVTEESEDNDEEDINVQQRQETSRT